MSNVVGFETVIRNLTLDISYFTMTIYLGADHRGFALKERMERWLGRRGHRVIDVGDTTLKPRDDYPDFASPLARFVVKQKARGILFCANGVGVCIAANKVHGVRAAIAWSVAAARTSRADDDTNVLCIPSLIPIMDTPERIITAWLTTKFSGAARHKRRLKKVAALDT